MIRTQVYIPTDLYSDAKLYANRLGISISELIRQGLQKVLYLKKSQESKTKAYTLSDMVGKYSVTKGKKVKIDHNEIYDI